MKTRLLGFVFAALLAAGVACAGPAADIELTPVSNPEPELPEGVYHPRAVDQIAYSIDRVEPVYPADLKKAGISGEVVLSILVDARGRVKSIVVLRATDARFAQAAERALKHWRFRPAMKDGRAVPCQQHQPVNFSNKTHAASGAPGSPDRTP